MASLDISYRRTHMFLKALASITILIPTARGIKKLWANPRLNTFKKIAGTLSIVIPLAIGLHKTWSKDT